jgi:hypothetical protein
MQIYDSCWSIRRSRNVSDKSCRKNRNMRILKSCCLWGNVEKDGTARHTKEDPRIRCTRDVILHAGYLARIQTHTHKVSLLVIVNCSMKYFVDWQQCRGIHCCISMETLNTYIVDSWMYTSNNGEWTYFFISVATLVTWTQRNIILYVYWLSCTVWNLRFSQQWLCT